MKKFWNWLIGLFKPDPFSNDGVSPVTNQLSSWLNKQTGGHLTGAEQEANAFSAAEAQKNRDWQEYMSNTSYQRSVADMQAAGVNPALAMSQGGASTPSGSAVTSTAPSSGGLSMSDIMQLALVGPNKRLIGAQEQKAKDEGHAAIVTAEANKKNAETREREVGLQEEELRTVKQPLAVSQIAYQDSVIDLNDAQRSKVYKEIDLVVADTDLRELQEIATMLDITWKTSTWELSKINLVAQIAKTQAEAAFSWAMKKKTDDEIGLLINEKKWSDIYTKYWTDPKNSDRGVNIEMMRGMNISTAVLTYLQALGDNMQDTEPGRAGDSRQGAPDVANGR